MASEAHVESSITSRELEAGFDHFLHSFVVNGSAYASGVVLVKSVPSSKYVAPHPEVFSPDRTCRLRKSAAHPPPARVAIPVSSCRATQAISPGIFSLAFQLRDETIHWVQNAEGAAASSKYINLADFSNQITALDGIGLGEQCADLRCKLMHRAIFHQ